MISTAQVGTLLQHAVTGVVAVKLSNTGEAQHRVHVLTLQGREETVPTETYRVIQKENVNSNMISAMLQELVRVNHKPIVRVSKTTSDGSSADYYKLPSGATQLQDLISHRNMNAQLGEIFRAAYRFGMASHSDQLRDAKKIKFYIEAEIKRLESTNE